MASQSQDLNLAVFLKQTLPESLKKCADETKQLIVTGHQELQPHLLKECENISEHALSTGIQNSMQKLQEIMDEKFLRRYETLIDEQILTLRNHPCVTVINNDNNTNNEIAMPNKQKYEHCDETLLQQQRDMYEQYVAKQKLLKQLNDETAQLQHRYHHTLNKISDNYQNMKAEAVEQHQSLRALLHQFKADYQSFDESMRANETVVDAENIPVNNPIANNKNKNESICNDWQVSAVLPL